jgi:hypothetical protein
MTEIVNNIAQVLQWDIFMMGLFMMLVLVTGIVWMTRSTPALHATTRSLLGRVTGSNPLLKSGGLVVLLVVVYYTGVLANTLSDAWIDSDYWHLGLKIFWDDKHKDDDIKNYVYGQIFKGQPRMPDEVRAFYYDAKNRLWKDDIWRQYILYSQTMVNFARVFCLASMLVIVLAGSRLLLQLGLLLGRSHLLAGIGKGWRPRRAPEIVVSLLGLFTAVGAYAVGVVVWKDGEVEVDSKVFGIYRTEYGSGGSRCRMVEIDGEPRIEASGVAAWPGGLAIVSDKDNRIYLASAPVSATLLPVVGVRGLPENRAKFEDIAYSVEAERFFVIGAHYYNKPDYQQTYSFRLMQSRGGWNAEDVVQIPLAGPILESMENRRAHVEGLAVVGPRDCQQLFVGIRDEGASLVRILEFSGQGDHFDFCSERALVLNPALSSSGVAYHLAGLFGESPRRLLVLCASEDDQQAFHGNRVFLADLPEDLGMALQLTAVTDEFQLAQKAEGLTGLRDVDGRWRYAVVFDNDLEDTHQVSRLMVAESFDAFCP